jgi:hypothetical protein
MHWTGEGGTLLANLVFNTLVNYLDSNGQRKKKKRVINLQIYILSGST